MTAIEEGRELLDHFVQLWENKYQKKLTLNIFKEKWGFVDVIDSVGVDRAKELVEYYFKVTQPGHPLQWFFFNFEKLDETLKAKERDRKRRELLREQTKERVINEH